MRRSRLLSDRKLLGRWGEKRCEKYLRRKSLKTVARNFSCKRGEIDLVMMDTSCDDGVIVFVEVKTRKDEDLAQAQDAVTFEKRRRLIRTAKYFLKIYKVERAARFDVVAVILGKTGPVEIRHYESAFVP